MCSCLDRPEASNHGFAMTVPAPHFLLFSEASEVPASGADAGRWRFVLEALDGSASLEAADDEVETSAERLELLAIVRGLEALDQPSHVTLIPRNRQISRGLRFGLEQWRENDWQWERFGEMTPVKNNDLWKRIDQTLQFHKVDCRAWKLEASDDLSEFTPGQRSAAATPAPVWRKDAGGRMLRLDPGTPRSQSPVEPPIRPARRPRWQNWLGALQQWLAGAVGWSVPQRSSR